MRRLDPKVLGEAADAVFGAGALLYDDVLVKAQLRVPEREHRDSSIRDLYGSLFSAYTSCRDYVERSLDSALGVEPLGKAEIYLDEDDGGGERVYKAAGHSGVMIALVVPQHVAEAVAVPRGESPGDMHVTLAYFGKVGTDAPRDVVDAMHSVVAKFASNHEPIRGALAGFGRFSASETSDGKDVIYASVDAPGLVELRHALLGALPLTPNKAHGFTPHVTLAYVEPLEQSPITRFGHIPVTFDMIALVVGDSASYFRLGMPVVVKADPAPAPSSSAPDLEWFDVAAKLAPAVDPAGCAAASSEDFATDTLYIIASLAALEFLVVAGDEVIPNEILLSEHPDEGGSLLSLAVRHQIAGLSAPQLALVFVGSCLHAVWSPTTRSYEITDGAPSTDLGTVVLAALRETAGISPTDATMDVLKEKLVEISHIVAERLNDANRGDALVKEVVQIGSSGSPSRELIEAAIAAIPDFGLDAERAA